MADGMSMDFSEITALTATLGKVVDNAGDDIRRAVTRTAIKVRNDWKEPLAGSQMVKGGGRYVTYSMGSSGESLLREIATTGAGELANAVVAEIGPENKGTGSLVAMLEYGTPSVGARGFGAAALEKNQGDFEKGLEKALQEAEMKAGLI